MGALYKVLYIPSDCDFAVIETVYENLKEDFLKCSH